MILHLSFEIPKPVSRALDHGSPRLTDEEVLILKTQIRRNTAAVSRYVSRLDLFVNQERYPRNEVFLQKIRERLELLMEENDTFRKVLWQHYQRLEAISELAA
jgi:hypothetical protein